MFFSRTLQFNLAAFIAISLISIGCGKQNDNGKPREPGKADPQPPTPISINGFWKGTLSTGTGTPKAESRRVEITFKDDVGDWGGIYDLKIATTPLALDVAAGYTVTGTYSRMEHNGSEAIFFTPKGTNFNLFTKMQSRTLDLVLNDKQLILSDDEATFDLAPERVDDVKPKPRPTNFDGTWKCTSLRTRHILVVRFSALGSFRLRIEEPGQEEVYGEGNFKLESGDSPKNAVMTIKECDRDGIAGKTLSAKYQSEVFMSITGELSAITGKNADTLEAIFHCQRPLS